MKKVFLLVAIVISIASCQKSDCKDAVKATFTDKSGLDGCGMVIKLSEDEYLEPSNLGEFSITPKDGMEIWVSYIIDNDAASTCMIGDIVKVECIEER